MALQTKPTEQKQEETHSVNEPNTFASQNAEVAHHQAFMELKEDEEDLMLADEEDQLKDLSNPASQDYVMEKLKDME